MKTSNVIYVTGIVIVITGAILRIFHLLPVNTVNAITLLGFLLWTAGQSMQIFFLKKEIEELKNRTS